MGAGLQAELAHLVGGNAAIISDDQLSALGGTRGTHVHSIRAGFRATWGEAPQTHAERCNRGVARRAGRLAADWLMMLPGVNEVELRIGIRHLESQRVAAAAGFLPSGAVRDVVERTGEVYEDLRFVYTPQF